MADDPKSPDFDRGAQPPMTPAEFEQKFLEFAYNSTGTLTAPSVAYALKVPIAFAEAQLEDLAARDVLVRDVDNDAAVFYRLPGRAQAPKSKAIVRAAPQQMQQRDPSAAIQPGASPQQMTGLLLNLVLPGVGSLVAGKTIEGVLQLILLLIGLPLCFVLIGFPIVAIAWGWAIWTGIRAMNEQK
jgi:TM2 domain-containing membrane protein YozV